MNQSKRRLGSARFGRRLGLSVTRARHILNACTRKPVRFPTQIPLSAIDLQSATAMLKDSTFFKWRTQFMSSAAKRQTAENFSPARGYQRKPLRRVVSFAAANGQVRLVAKVRKEPKSVLDPHVVEQDRRLDSANDRGLAEHPESVSLTHLSRHHRHQCDTSFHHRRGTFAPEATPITRSQLRL